MVTEHVIADTVRAEMIAQGCYFLNQEEISKLEALIRNPRGGLNSKIVGKPAAAIARMAGVEVPPFTQVLVAEQARESVGKDFPFSWEKLSPLLGFYRVQDAHEACELCMELLNYEGAGHTLALHTQDHLLIQEFALKKPVSRLVREYTGYSRRCWGDDRSATCLDAGLWWYWCDHLHRTMSRRCICLTSVMSRLA